MGYGGETGQALETPAGRVVARTARVADLPWLNAVAETSPNGRGWLPMWQAEVRANDVTALADPDGTVWGFLAVSADEEGDVSLRWVVPERHADMLAPTLAAVATDLTERGHSPVGLVVREDAAALVHDLRRHGFEVDVETSRKGRLGLVATRWSLARAASPEPARTPSLADATDEELAAEVHRRVTMAAAMVTRATVREELRLGGHGLSEDALDAGAGLLFDMVRTGLAVRMEKAASTHVYRKWVEAGDHLLEKVAAPTSKP